jgi:hypothetical protein
MTILNAGNEGNHGVECFRMNETLQKEVTTQGDWNLR